MGDRVKPGHDGGWCSDGANAPARVSMRTTHQSRRKTTPASQPVNSASATHITP